MRRRTFIAQLAATAAWPLIARAEQATVRIGFLSPVSAADLDKAQIPAFEAGLRELGYIPGKSIEIEYRYGDGNEAHLAELVRELVDLKVDLIVSMGSGVYAAHRVTKSVPIVTAVNGDLVSLGLADSLGHPGGNVTGLTYFFAELMVKRIALLQQIKPEMTTVGVLVAQGYSVNRTFLGVMEAPVKALGIELRPIEIAESSDCDRALSSSLGGSIGGLVLFDPPQFTSGSAPAEIAAAAARHGLPSAGALPFAPNGGLLSYGVDYVPMHHRAAFFVDKILKGANPGDIPIEQATKFTTIVNLKTAKALGLEIPPTLLAAADEVIE